MRLAALDPWGTAGNPQLKQVAALQAAGAVLRVNPDTGERAWWVKNGVDAEGAIRWTRVAGPSAERDTTASSLYGYTLAPDRTALIHGELFYRLGDGRGFTFNPAFRPAFDANLRYDAQYGRVIPYALAEELIRGNSASGWSEWVSDNVISLMIASVGIGAFFAPAASLPLDAASAGAEGAGSIAAGLDAVTLGETVLPWTTNPSLLALEGGAISDMGAGLLDSASELATDAVPELGGDYATELSNSLAPPEGPGSFPGGAAKPFNWEKLWLDVAKSATSFLLKRNAADKPPAPRASAPHPSYWFNTPARPGVTETGEFKAPGAGLSIVDFAPILLAGLVLAVPLAGRSRNSRKRNRSHVSKRRRAA